MVRVLLAIHSLMKRSPGPASGLLVMPGVG